MPKIILDTFTYKDILEILDEDIPFLRHKMEDLLHKYRRLVIKTKPRGLTQFDPVTFKSNRGLDYRFVLTTFGYADAKKRNSAVTIHAYYLKPDGLYLVSFSRRNSTDILDNPRHVFFTPHFFDRFKERAKLPMEMSKLEVMNTFLKRNSQSIFSDQENPSYPEGMFGVFSDGVGLGKALEDGHIELKTFVTFEMLKGEQLDKKAVQLEALNEYKSFIFGKE